MKRLKFLEEMAINQENKYKKHYPNPIASIYRTFILYNISFAIGYKWGNQYYEICEDPQFF